MNGKITISIVIVFAFVLTSFFTMSYFSPVQHSTMKNHPFYESLLNSNNHVFLFGNSMVAQLNVTKINEIVLDEHPEHLVYNLAFNADNPNTRLFYLEKFSNFKPSHVFYGISYTDFYNWETDETVEPLLPDPKITFEQFIESNNQNFGPFNPKISTLQALRTSLSFTGLFPPTTENKIYLENAQFSYFAEYQRIIHTDKANLERYTPVDEIQTIEISYSMNNQKIQNFKEIIKKLKQQDISVVIFLAPLHLTYLSNIQSEENEKFEQIIDDIQKEFDVPVYDFRENYVDMEIWMDVSHIAYHKDSMIYSEDIANMILSEI